MKDHNPLLELQDYGQSIWLDFISRGMLESGELQALIEEDGLRGVTVNPSILDEAIRETDDYEEAIEDLAAQEKGIPVFDAAQSAALCGGARGIGAPGQRSVRVDGKRPAGCRHRSYVPPE